MTDRTSSQSANAAPQDASPASPPLQSTIDYGREGSAGNTVAESRPQRIDPYQILELQAEGGMGAVYLAEQKEPVRRRVAMMLVKLGMDTTESVNHRHIPAVLDAGPTEHGRPHFVMEYVPGIPISEYCDWHRTGSQHISELRHEYQSPTQRGK